MLTVVDPEIQSQGIGKKLLAMPRLLMHRRHQLHRYFYDSDFLTFPSLLHGMNAMAIKKPGKRNLFQRIKNLGSPHSRSSLLYWKKN